MKIIPLILAGLSGFVFAATPKGLASSDWSSIRAAYDAGRHAIQSQENGSLIARNPGQQWRTEFDGQGFLITPDHGQWTWGLELTGYADRTLPSALLPITHEGNKISNQRDTHLTEWFINDTRGLEQGWTIQERSTGVSPVSLILTVRGDLHAQVSPDSTSIAFQTPSGSTALTYSGLKAWDADGKNLPVHFEPAGETAIRIAVDDQNARYPITIDPIAQQAYLKASNPGASDGFGYSVAISGDTVVVGALYENSNRTGVNSTPNENAPSSGAAYVFIRNGSTWSQQAYLKASNTTESDNFGVSVAVSGDTIVVGAAGEDSSSSGVNSTPNEIATDSGAAYVFTRSGSTWSQQAFLKASNPESFDNFGISVSVSGDTVVVGAPAESSSTTGVNSTPNESASSAGAAYVFARSGTTWSQQAYLKASNTAEFVNFGESVAVAGDTIVVGAPGEDSSRPGMNTPPNQRSFDSGAAYVFTRSGTSWSQQAYLKASNSSDDDYFGDSVAVSGDTLVVGASNENGIMPDGSTFAAGAAYIFSRTSTTWSQQAYLKAINPRENDGFGLSVAVSGNTVVVGAYQEDRSTVGGIADDSGAAYVFTRSGTTWSREAHLKASNPGNADFFGISVAVSGGTIVIGASDEDSSTTGVNSTPNEAAANSGAVYTFTISNPVSEFQQWATLAGLVGANALPAATPYGDGTPNLLKFAFNMSGSGPDVSRLIPGTGTSGLPFVNVMAAGANVVLRVEFIRRKSGGLIYTPKRSSTLAQGSFTAMTGIPAVTQISGTNGLWERVVVEEPLNPTVTPRAFVTVEVTLSE